MYALVSCHESAYLSSVAIILNSQCLFLYFFSILLCCNTVTLDFSGAHQAEMKGNKVGKLFLTTHRAIFLNGDSKDKFQSFSFPFVTMSEVELEQPMFGANFIKGKVRAQANGNWVGEAKFKLHFKHGGAIDFGQALLKAAHMGENLVKVFDWSLFY
jgi:WW domain-binding protein 2